METYLVTAESIIDSVPQNLPVTCLRKLWDGVWRLKTATESGVTERNFSGSNDLDIIENAMVSYNKLPQLEVGPLILCFDGKSYIGLESKIRKVFVKDFVIKQVKEVTFPWPHEPRN